MLLLDSIELKKHVTQPQPSQRCNIRKVIASVRRKDGYLCLSSCLVDVFLSAAANQQGDWVYPAAGSDGEPFSSLVELPPIEIVIDEHGEAQRREP